LAKVVYLRHRHRFRSEQATEGRPALLVPTGVALIDGLTYERAHGDVSASGFRLQARPTFLIDENLQSTV
jgi:hypothetical protein